ncbi:MAG: EAL domain-containing protein [Acetobacteraceae bacterium]
MRTHSLNRLGMRLLRHRPTLQEACLLLACMIFAAIGAYSYDIFSGSDGQAPVEQTIELDEALALAGLLCLGLLVLSWRFLLAQRREVARRIAAERVARELALQDPLTGLPNRRRFDEELKAAAAAHPRTGGAHALLLLDLNGFKRVNDLHGHGVGDEVLIKCANRLQRAVRDGDLVARLGGDEFAILARHLAGAEEATSIALRVIRELEQPITTGPTRHEVGTGIGIALMPRDGEQAGEIMRKADIALYRAKALPVSTSCFFDAEMDAHVRERDLIERDLRAAIREGAIVPCYQPLIDLATNEVTGFEALARWKHPTLGDVPPERFIPIAESCGLIDLLTDRLLRLAARAACQWPDRVTLSFNISPSQLKDHTLAARILEILKEVGLPPRRLEIELTEAAVVRDLAGAQRVLGALRDAGVRIALDDFGTGYSSLYHLRNFKVDKIKIDRSFVRGHAARAGGGRAGAGAARTGPGAWPDRDGRGRGVAGAGGLAARAGMRPGAGLPVRSRHAGRGGGRPGGSAQGAGSLAPFPLRPREREGRPPGARARRQCGFFTASSNTLHASVTRLSAVSV